MNKLLWLALFCFFSVHCTANDEIRYVDSKEYPDPKTRYFVDLLTLALEKTKKDFGEYTLTPVAIEMAQARTSSMLENNKIIDLTWRMTSKDLEQRLTAIYVPLLKGMMGYRIFIIRANEQNKFSKNISFEQLTSMSVGQGYNWPDSDILEHNSFDVVRGYDNYLLKMLAKKRFDYFPRALHEPWHEVQGNSDLTVEQHLLLKYVSPIYFFVNNNNKRLIDRLNKGMAAIVASGEMDELFNNHPITANIIEKSKPNRRSVFVLENPLISEKTKQITHDKRLWLEVID
ncbi:substrate-binding periplasmic protein [Thalassotalea sp. PLHSN55]|uniref:substrate-binding periplasmic protein n=1 Tax=Thalassotalea sp. PLHSN55 TaxID=3435888 RepID=UPI003F86118C